MAVVDELLAIGEEDRRKKQFLQDNPLFGMEPYHEVRPTYSNRYTETLGSLLEPLMTKPDAGPLDINFWTGLLSTPLVKSMRPREEPTKMEYAFSGVPFTPGLGVAPSLGRAAAKRFVPEFDPSRRTFLKTSATVGALTGLGIPLAKKALTKSTGAIESLAGTLKDNILKLDSLEGINKAFNEFDIFANRLRKVASKAEDSKALSEASTKDALEHTTYQFDQKYVHPVNEHIGTGRWETKSVYHPDENVYMPEVDYDSLVKVSESTGLIKKEMESAQTESQRRLKASYKGYPEEAYSEAAYHEADEAILDVMSNQDKVLRNTLTKLNVLEKHDPETLIRLLDEEIAETSELLRRIADPIAGFGSRKDRLEVYNNNKISLAKLKEIRKQIADRLNIPKPKKKDDVSIVQRVLDPLGYTRMKAPYEK